MSTLVEFSLKDFRKVVKPLFSRLQGINQETYVGGTLQLGNLPHLTLKGKGSKELSSHLSLLETAAVGE